MTNVWSPIALFNFANQFVPSLFEMHLEISKRFHSMKTNYGLITGYRYTLAQRLRLTHVRAQRDEQNFRICQNSRDRDRDRSVRSSLESGRIGPDRIGSDRDASGARGRCSRDKDPSFIREIKSPRHYPEVYPRECPRKLMPRVDQSEPVWASRFSSPATRSETPLGPSLA